MITSSKATTMYLSMFCRFISDNRLFGGLWFGSKKPKMNIFLKPMVHDLAKLYNEGTQN